MNVSPPAGIIASMSENPAHEVHCLWALVRAAKHQAQELRRQRVLRASASLRRWELDLLRRLVILEGPKPPILNSAASAHRALDQTALAWDACESSLDRDPSVVTNRPAWTVKGALLREAGAYEAAVETLEAVRTRYPEDTFVLRALIPAYAGLAFVSGEERHLRKITTLAEELADLARDSDDPVVELRALISAAEGPEKLGLERALAWLLQLSGATQSA